MNLMIAKDSRPQGNIAIIGGGPMGLAAAYRLAQSGFKPVLFESDDRLGGMAASFDFDGTKVERYYHFHCTSDQRVIDLLKELGLLNHLKWKKTQMGFYTQGRLQDWGNPLALLRFQGASWISKIRYGLHAFTSVKRTSWKSLDQQNARDWIRKWLGDTGYNVFWKSLFDLKFFQYAHEISAAWIWNRIYRMGNSRYNLMAEKLGVIEGGSETLIHAISKTIMNHNGEIRLNNRVSHIQKTNSKFIVSSHSTSEEFDAVISTIPTPILPKLFPSLPNELKRLWSLQTHIAVACVIAKLKKPMSKYFWININDPEIPLPGLIEYSNLANSNETIIYAPFYMPIDHPDYRKPDQEFFNHTISAIQTINPFITNEDISNIRVHRYDLAQPICRPHHLESLPPVQTEVSGFFAADSSYYYPNDRGISESITMGEKMACLALQFLSNHTKNSKEA